MLKSLITGLFGQPSKKRVADWQCTRCNQLKSRILAGESCGQPGTGHSCPMVPVDGQGDKLGMDEI